MINAVNEQFSRFVNFAEDQRAKGAKTAIATMGDVAAKGDTPLEERNIKITDKSDWVGNVFFRKDEPSSATRCPSSRSTKSSKKRLNAKRG